MIIIQKKEFFKGGKMSETLINGLPDFVILVKSGEDFIGWYLGFYEKLNGDLVARFQDAKGIEFCIDGPQIDYLIKLNKFEMLKKYRIVYLNDIEIIGGVDKGLKIKNYYVYLLDEK